MYAESTYRIFVIDANGKAGYWESVTGLEETIDVMNVFLSHYPDGIVDTIFAVEV